MKKERQITITEFFCDVCGQECGNYARRIDADGTEHHACLQHNDQYDAQCVAVLDQRLLDAAIARRNQAKS